MRSEHGNADYRRVPVNDLERFDPRLALPFSEKSNSEETRGVYRRVVRQFFSHVRGGHPRQVTPADVLALCG
jgi:hypothetical protein